MAWLKAISIDLVTLGEGTVVPLPGQKAQLHGCSPFLKRSPLLDIWKNSRSSAVIGELPNQIVTLLSLGSTRLRRASG